MAGSYPDVPSRRFAWDADGTIFGVVNLDTGILTEASVGQKTEANDEDNEFVGGLVGGGTAGGHFVHIFPELREIDGFFGRSNVANGFVAVDTSGDTTNGIGGTWTNRIASYTDPNTDVITTGESREEITSLAVSNVRGIRVTTAASQAIRAIHLYGTIAAGETTDRLLWVDNDDDLEFSESLDYGDIPRGSASDEEAYLTNNSGSLTAGSVQVTAEALYLGADAWFTFKEAGGSFSATLALASAIGAGSDSPVITIRRVTPDDETLGLHAARAYANVGSWT